MKAEINRYGEFTIIPFSPTEYYALGQWMIENKDKNLFEEIRISDEEAHEW